MGQRTYILFCLALSASAAVIGSQSTRISSVIVTAKPDYSLTSGPNTIITQDQIMAAGMMNLSQALQNLGGITLQDILGNGNQVSLSMRGFGDNATSNTLFLVNGIPITNPDLAGPNLNIIPIYAIKYIEVISGSESVLYGDQAVGGVVNVVTADDNPRAIKISCGYGSYNAAQCMFALQNQYHRLKYNILFFSSRTDNYRAHNDYNFNRLLGGFLYPYSFGEWRVDYNIGNEYMQYPGSLTNAQVRENRRQASNNSDYFKDWNNFFNLQQTHQFSANWQLNTDFAMSNLSGNGVLYAPFNQTRSTYFLKPKLKGRLYHALVLSGLEVGFDRYSLTSLLGERAAQQKKAGLFALIDFPWRPDLIFSIGARGAQLGSHLRDSYVSNNNINRALATTIGVTYHYTRWTSFYLRRAGSFRFPKADENAATPAGVNGLRTQRGIAYEAGMNRVCDAYSIKAGVYQLALRDEIAFDPTQTPEEPFGSNRNLSPTMRYGLSLSFQQQLSSRLQVNAQYNFVDARFRNGIYADNHIPLVSENIFHSGVNFQFADRWFFYAEAVFTGSQFPANDDANVAGKMGGYTVYNANLRYLRKHLTIDFHVNNLFNKQYYFYTAYQMGSDFFYPAPERNVMLTASYNL